MQPSVVTAPSDPETEPELWDVVEALADPECRAFLRALSDPTTAQELSQSVGVPLTTTYRKLNELEAAGLLETRTEIRVDGRNETLYATTVEELALTVDGTRYEERIAARGDGGSPADGSREEEGPAAFRGDDGGP